MRVGSRPAQLFIRHARHYAVDLDPDSPGDGIAIKLKAGANPISIPATLDMGGAQRFTAVFEPSDPEADSLEENNIFEAVTFVSSDGRVLVYGDPCGRRSPVATLDPNCAPATGAQR